MCSFYAYDDCVQSCCREQWWSEGVCRRSVAAVQLCQCFCWVCLAGLTKHIGGQRRHTGYYAPRHHAYELSNQRDNKVRHNRVDLYHPGRYNTGTPHSINGDVHHLDLHKAKVWRCYSIWMRSKIILCVFSLLLIPDAGLYYNSLVSFENLWPVCNHFQ